MREGPQRDAVGIAEWRLSPRLAYTVTIVVTVRIRWLGSGIMTGLNDMCVQGVKRQRAGIVPIASIV